MPIYNLLGYSSNYSDTRRSLWFYSKGEASNFNVNVANSAAFKYFMYKAKLIEETKVQAAPNVNDGILKDATNAVPLEYLSNILTSLEITLK